MLDRSQARYLAPLALAAFLVVFIVVVASSGGGGTGASKAPKDAAAPQTTQTAVATTTTPKPPPAPPRTYTVQASDGSLAAIAQKTGVSQDQLLQLNPNLDPQSLAPGQRIRLRP